MAIAGLLSSNTSLASTISIWPLVHCCSSSKVQWNAIRNVVSGTRTRAPARGMDACARRTRHPKHHREQQGVQARDWIHRHLLTLGQKRKKFAIKFFCCFGCTKGQPERPRLPVVDKNVDDRTGGRRSISLLLSTFPPLFPAATCTIQPFRHTLQRLRHSRAVHRAGTAA